MNKALFWGLAIAIVVSNGVLGQGDTRIRDVRRQLQQIRQEIGQLEQKLQSTESRLRNELEVMETLDRQISLVHRAITILTKEIQDKQRLVQSLNDQIDSLSEQINILQSIFSRQIVFAYKYQRGKQLSWILGSQNFNQALVRYRYFQKVAASARKIFNRLKQKQEEKKALQQKLETELANLQQLVEDKRLEQKSLQRKRSERRKIVERIKRNKTLLARSLEQKKKNYRELQRLIARLEKNRQNRKLAPKTQAQWEKISGDFARQKGKLNWPVTGKIIHPFGRYKNPKLKTVLINSGIDIRAPKGARVRCVFPGVVSLITYMSGFGNTVIIDHNNGYYTVYTHLDEILVQKFEFVEAGAVIGTVGDSGSLEGTMLHFEIYGGNKPLNPLQWLKKR